MGYRSNVAIKCEEKAYEMFKQVFAKKEMWIMPDKIYKDENCYIILWLWVKWYGCEVVDEITNVMDKLNDNGNETGGYGYKFVRIGEEYDDTEIISNDENIDLWIIHEIDIPDNLEEIKI